MATASELPSLADAPGTAREYETIYVVRPNTSNDGLADVNGRVRGIIEKLGGKVLKVDNWGKRRLAYEVSKERKGIYLYWQYLARRGVVDEIERNFRMLDSVIRYQTVRLDDNVDPEARPSDVDDETYEAAATTAADEEDLYLTRAAEAAAEAEAEAAAEAASDEEADEGGDGEKAEAASDEKAEAASDENAEPASDEKTEAASDEKTEAASDEEAEAASDEAKKTAAKNDDSDAGKDAGEDEE